MSRLVDRPISADEEVKMGETLGEGRRDGGFRDEHVGKQSGESVEDRVGVFKCDDGISKGRIRR